MPEHRRDTQTILLQEIPMKDLKDKLELWNL